MWNNQIELDFFNKMLKTNIKEKLFYKLNNEYYAYIPKDIKSKDKTLQSRNTLIGNFTECWTKEILSPIARKHGLYAVNGVSCDEISLSKKSRADVAFCTTNDKNQTTENIKIIFEVKMSIVSNYKLDKKNKVHYLGDYRSHKGQPSLLRSDSMLKAIGKAINIRVSSLESSKIPIIVIGNTPITENYSDKVDFLKSAGVVQGFLSLNPNPIDKDFISSSDNLGFQTIKNKEELSHYISELLGKEFNYFSSMLSKNELGNIILIASKEKTNELRAHKFLQMIREEK